MSRTWRDVWAEVHVDPSRHTVLSRLMGLDGLDTPFGVPTETAWREFVWCVVDTLGISAGSTVLEVGCGAGAFLYDLYRAGHAVAGLDPSEAQVGHARQAMPGADFWVAEATALDSRKTHDFVVSCAVFLYFPDLVYAREVIRRIASTATKGIAILDVPDVALEERALAARRALLGEAKYEERYRGLDHLYYERDWLKKAFYAEGATTVRVEDQAIPGYGNGPFRFNLFAWFPQGAQV